MAQQIEGHVHIVDDEPGVLDTIGAMLHAGGFTTSAYPTADALIERLDDLEPGCIIADVNMPGMSGLEMVRQLKARNTQLPVIVISGQADIPMAVEAMKAGAVDFLEKPLHSEPLHEAVRAALASGSAASASPDTERYVKIVQSLTRRQREVLAGVIEGLPNKLIAYRLGLSIRTVEGYRAAIMERTRVRSLSELVRLGIRAGL